MHQDQATTNRKTGGPMEEIRRLRDEIRLEIHLASRDLRDEWHRLEKRLPPTARLARELRATTIEVLDSLTRELRTLRAKLDQHSRDKPL